MVRTQGMSRTVATATDKTATPATGAEAGAEAGTTAWRTKGAAAGAAREAAGQLQRSHPTRLIFTQAYHEFLSKRTNESPASTYGQQIHDMKTALIDVQFQTAAP